MKSHDSNPDAVREKVRAGYSQIALHGSERRKSSCCNGMTAVDSEKLARQIGYSAGELAGLPEGANIGLSCGNPSAVAALRSGEVLLDLGSGGGFDAFIAGPKVGSAGRVIGVDMTPEMLDKARENARKSGYTNVEFRLGEIENLPAADNSVNAIISNCVINLAPEKKRVFKEAFRVLKPGGRIMVSDIVLTKALPEAIRNSIAAYVGCISGASLESDYLADIKAAGFKDIKVVGEAAFPMESMKYDPMAQEIMESLNLTPEKMRETAGTVKSVRVHAIKPK